MECTYPVFLMQTHGQVNFDFKWFINTCISFSVLHIHWLVKVKKKTSKEQVLLGIRATLPIC